MENTYNGRERREFVRLPYSTPLAYKICKAETLSKLLEGYTVNVSQAGLRCNIKQRVGVDEILWLAFDKSVLIIVTEMERHSLIYQNGVIGKVARVQELENHTFDIGVKFLTREEKDLTDVRVRTVHLRQELGDEKLF